MNKVVRHKGSRKPRRVTKGIPHTIHIRKLSDQQLEELWSLRYYINAFDWIDIIEWTLKKYREELEQQKVII